jgi:hypothetical protein
VSNTALHTVLNTAHGSELEAALTAAATFTDLESPGTAQLLRKQFSAEVAAWALTQTDLRRKAAAKLGERAARMYFTPTGLEQATRASVSDWRAARIRELGVSGVIDLTAGLGADAIAFLAAGLSVVAVERDAETAEYLAHNLSCFATAGIRAEVIVGDAVELVDTLHKTHSDYAIYLDPARRTAAGRSWKLSDLTPSWEFVTGLLADAAANAPANPVIVKLAPGFPLSEIPTGVAPCWVSDQGVLVELSLWPGTGRKAVVLRNDAVHTLALSPQEPTPPPPPAAAPRAYLIEPDPAVIRSGLAPLLAAGLTALSPAVAYLSSDTPLDTPLASCFEVLEVLPFDMKALRSWVRINNIGILEIKKRAVEIDPDALRKKLRPTGKRSATLIISPTVSGVKVFSCRRVGTRLA